MGNLISKGADTLAYNGAQPHAVTHRNGTQQFWYDDNGNMTDRINQNGDSWVYTWNLENKMDTATDGTDTVRFVYDADGFLIQRLENEGQGTETDTILLGKLYEHERNGNKKTKHYFFGGLMVARSVQGNVQYMITDHLGTPTLVLNTNGSVSFKQRMDAWGNQRFTQNTDQNGFRYTGQRYDDTLGLHDYNARYYDAEIGRFLSADTIVPPTMDKEWLTPMTVGFHEREFLYGLNKESKTRLIYGAVYKWTASLVQELGLPMGSSEPQLLNRYSYVTNSPVMFTDDTGHEGEEVEFSVAYEWIDEGDGWWRLRLSGDYVDDIEILIHESHEDFHTVKRVADDLKAAEEGYNLAIESGDFGDKIFWWGLAATGVSILVTIAGFASSPTGIGLVVGIIGAIATIASLAIAVFGYFYSNDLIIEQITHIQQSVTDEYINNGGIQDLIDLFSSCENDDLCEFTILEP